MFLLVLMESIVMCFILLLVCVVGISNGAVGLVVLYEKDVQERVVELGLTTKEKLKRTNLIASVSLFAPVLILVPAMVYFINGAREFMDLFLQMTAIMMIMTAFDRIFIDWYWVGHTKAWFILGTEDLMPYIPKKVIIKKWVGSIISFPMIAAILSAIITFLN